MLAAVDLKKTFDLVHHAGLWDPLRLRWIPARVVGLLMAYTLKLRVL